MKVIELCGKAGVGKDTFGLELIKQLEQKGFKCVHLAFADRVKDICTRYFNWDGNKDESGRHLLQYIGTEIFRNYDPDYWVKEIVTLLKVFSSAEMFDYAIITDARFPNEIQGLISNFETFAFKINRKNFKSNLTQDAQKHLSETALNDFIIPEIILSGEIEKLPQEVEEFIENWRI